MSRVDWDFGGMTDIRGNLGKPVPSGQVIVPGKIELEGDAIHWELAGPARAQEISRSTLNEFVKLWEGNAVAILKFAKRWGVLIIDSWKTKGGKVRYRPCGSMAKGVDPIESWKYYSRRAYALLNIAAALRRGKLGDGTDWEVIAAFDDRPESFKAADEQHRYGMGWYVFPKSNQRRSAVDQSRDLVATEVRMWLSFWRQSRRNGLSDFSVQWSQKRERWELGVDYHGFLFAALALQLALSVAGAESLYTCSGCGAPYVRELKRPKPGTSNYCRECSEKGIAQRRAVDAYREKKAEAISLAAAGTPDDEIARKLGAPLSRIRKWLKAQKKRK
jgi:hypothetical protein